MKKYIFAIIAFGMLLASCNHKNVSSTKTEPAPDVDSIVRMKKDSMPVNDTICLSQIAEEVTYMTLDLPHTSRPLQIHYTDSLVFANNQDGIYWFDHSGKKKGQIKRGMACFDLSEHQDSIYVYNALDKRLTCYDLQGECKWTSRLQYEGTAGSYGNYFSCIGDTLFAIAIQNEGFNPDRLVFVDKKGKVKVRVPNPEAFAAPGMHHTAHTDWKRELTKNLQTTFYHPLYGDTIYRIDENLRLVPDIIEQKVDKVPLEARPEYTGKIWKEFASACQEKDMYVTRVFNTSRYVVVEYRWGNIGFCLANYWVYDRKERKMFRTFNDWEALFASKKMHLGIYNDYDGGLAFVPEYLSNDHLIMVNASELQGRKSAWAKALYAGDPTILEGKYTYRSDVYQNPALKQKADAFWSQCDSEKIVLTIVKTKSK